MDLNEIASKLSVMHAVKVELALACSIGQRLGRVPTSVDIAQHGIYEVHPGFTRYLWDGKELFTLHEKWEGDGFRLEIKYA